MFFYYLLRYPTCFTYTALLTTFTAVFTHFRNSYGSSIINISPILQCLVYHGVIVDFNPLSLSINPSVLSSASTHTDISAWIVAFQVSGLIRYHCVRDNVAFHERIFCGCENFVINSGRNSFWYAVRSCAANALCGIFIDKSRFIAFYHGLVLLDIARRVRSA